MITWQTEAPKAEQGMALGISLIALLVLLLIGALVAGVEPSRPPRPGLGTTLTGLYMMAWGAMFLASYFFDNKTFFLRGLMWVCENMSSPSGRGMAFFYAALGLILGFVMVLYGIGAW